jgi:hypothetical protein
MRPNAAAMKALLNESALQVVPGCGDGLGARLVEEAGFRIGFASGSSISATRLAMPDMDLLTFPEMRDAVEAMIAVAPNVLWLADGDTGYGNAISVQKTVRAYTRAGAAAVLIEDKQWPRQLGHKGAKLVVDREEARLRCRAAVAAAREEGVLLLARTDARASRGFEEALSRLKDFVAEGADIFFLARFTRDRGRNAGVGCGLPRQAGHRRDQSGRKTFQTSRRCAGLHRNQDGDLSARDPGSDGTGGQGGTGGIEGWPEGRDGGCARPGDSDPIGRLSGTG